MTNTEKLRNGARGGVMNEVTCFTCGGSGLVSGHAQTSVGHYWGEMACSMCRGWGTVPADLEQRREAGEAARQEARERGMTLRMEAARLGLDVVELSRRWFPTSDRGWNPEATRPMHEWMEARKERGRG